MFRCSQVSHQTGPENGQDGKEEEWEDSSHRGSGKGGAGLGMRLLRTWSCTLMYAEWLVFSNHRATCYFVVTIIQVTQDSALKHGPSSIRFGPFYSDVFK